MREGGQVRPLANDQKSLPSPDCGLSGHLPLTSPVHSPSGDEQSLSPWTTSLHGRSRDNWRDKSLPSLGEKRVKASSMTWPRCCAQGVPEATRPSRQSPGPSGSESSPPQHSKYVLPSWAPNIRRNSSSFPDLRMTFRRAIGNWKTSGKSLATH